MSNRPPIPPEHRPILARLLELMLEWARAENEKGEIAAAQSRPPDSPTVVKPSPL